MGDYRDCVVIRRLTGEIFDDEVAVMLEEITGPGTVKENDRRSERSTDGTRMCLAMESREAAEHALKERTFYVEGRRLTIVKWTSDWDKKQELRTSSSISDFRSDVVPEPNFILYDPSLDNLSEDFDVGLPEVTEAIPERVEDTPREKEELIEVPEKERTDFILQLLKPMGSRYRCDVAKDATGDIKVSGLSADVDTFVEIAYQDVIPQIESHTKSEFSKEGAEIIYKNCILTIRASLAFAVEATVILQEGVLVVLAKNNEEMKKADDILDKLLMRQKFEITEPEFMESTKGEQWKSFVNSLCTPPRIHMYVRVNDRGGSKVIIEGQAEYVQKAADESKRWLKENTVTTVTKSLSYPVYCLLKDVIREESTLAKFIPKFTGKSLPKIEYEKGKNGDHDYKMHINGPLDVVKIFADALKLDDFVQKFRFEINKPGITRTFFNMPQAQTIIQMIQYPNKCFIHPCQSARNDSPRAGSLLPPDLSNVTMQASMDPEPAASNRDSPVSTIKVFQGNLTKWKVDVIVCAVVSNAKSLSNGGALGKAIAQAGGDEVTAGFDEILHSNDGRIPLGEASITAKVGNLKCKHIIYVAVRHWNTKDDQIKLEKIVSTLILKCLSKSQEVKAKSIAYPTIGCGAVKFPPTVVAECFKNTVNDWFRNNPEGRQQVSIVSFDAATKQEFDQILVAAAKSSGMPSPGAEAASHDNSHVVFAGRKRKPVKSDGPFSSIKVTKGDLTKDTADMVVCTVVARAKTLVSGGALGKAVGEAGGANLAKAFEDICAANNGHLPLGEANLASSVGDLKCKHVVFLALRHWDGKQPQRLEDIVKNLISKTLDRAKERGAKSVTFPTIGCGAVKFPAALVASCFRKVVPMWQGQNMDHQIQVSIIAHDDRLRKEFQDNISRPVTSTRPHIPRKPLHASSKKHTVANVHFEIYFLGSSNVEKSIKSELQKTMSELIKEEPLKLGDIKLTDLETNEIQELESLSVEGAYMKIGNKQIMLAGDQKAIKVIQESIHEVLKRVSTRLNDPDFIKAKYGVKSYLVRLSEENDATPKHWTKNKTFGDKVKNVLNIDTSTLLKADTRMAQAITDLMMKTWDETKAGHGHDARGLTHKQIRVKQIFVNQNKELYQHYHQYFKHVCKMVGQGTWRQTPVTTLGKEREIQTVTLNIPELEAIRTKEINEYFLFHGTTEDNKEAIAKQGVDFRFGNGLFGKGVYFAESSTKSDQYSDRPTVPGATRKTGGSHYMFICRVILRDPYLCKKAANEWVRAPCNKGCESDRCRTHINPADQHDSVIGIEKGDGNRLIFREFVVYEKHQCYPDFLVEYERI